MNLLPRIRERSHYQVLGLDPEAEPFLVEAAYRALMRRYHPDRGGETWRAQQINEAFSVLSDPVARARYDNQLAAAALAPPAPELEHPLETRRAQAHAALISHAYVGLALLLVLSAALTLSHGQVRHGGLSQRAASRPLAAGALAPSALWKRGVLAP